MWGSVQSSHWLGARAQKNRWKEEHILVGYEMEWSVRYFLYWEKVWEEHCNVAVMSMLVPCLRFSHFWQRRRSTSPLTPTICCFIA
ncbi:hypothetical protein BYT27DRAFT_7084446 [Phlegmacium glaucopus]|nr:hypothetical protein BYT27DRAFT_7084446 [Phlegmacium glaucopus]